ncbi:hypothetical protein TWF191_002597 [Orbilia oligospora]|uniref:F-box domain-containing protein n=1 Tax=Orbilia oligospora TaxID=2813651 RepID=A0A7C8Q9J4_ORBOL|nr:hypothetical protein TWF191_002597 [Orbilia oligospora]
MSTLFVPLEIQYHILSFAILDWTSQPSLRKVCKSWQFYIDTSPEAFSARYTNAYCHKAGQEEFFLKPQFHNAIVYCHKNFYKTQEDPPKFSPCVFEISEEDGDVASISLEIDLEMFFKDPIYKPAEIKSRSGTLELSISPEHPILPPTYMTILYPDYYSFRHPWFYGPIPPYKDAIADAEFTRTATVGDFLMSIPRTIDSMMEFLYLSCDHAGREKAMLIKYFETSLRAGSCREGDKGLSLFVREVNGGRSWCSDLYLAPREVYY